MQARRWLLMLLFAFPFASCGYDGTPLVFDLEAISTDGRVLRELDLEGVADPDASSFDRGVLLWTRWGVEREGVATVELLIDVDRSAFPEELKRGGEHVTLSTDGPNLQVILRGRDLVGDLVLEENPAAELTLEALVERNSRELFSGRISVTWSGGALYSGLAGFWETVPKPGGSSVLGGDVVLPGDPGPGDPGPGDPGPTDTDDDTVLTFDEGGCDCGGGLEEDIPDEEPPPVEEEEPSDDSGGCSSCEGDGFEEEDPNPPTDTDSTDDTTSDDSSGCDCAGDSAPEEELSALKLSSGGTVAQYRRPKTKRRRCRQSPLRLGLELSPLGFIYILSRRRRKMPSRS